MGEKYVRIDHMMSMADVEIRSNSTYSLVITLPKVLKDRLGLEPGDKVELLVHPTRLDEILCKIRPGERKKLKIARRKK